MAQCSQEGEFPSGEEAETPVQVSQNVSQPSVPVALPPSEIGRSPTNSSKAPEAEDTHSLKDLRDSVYTIMRDVNKVPVQSPPRSRRLTSTFEASCVMSQDTSKSHTSFPQFNHISNSLQIINDRIVANEYHFSKVSGFGFAFLMSISVLKIMIFLTLLWVSWYLLVTKLHRLLLIPDHLMNCVFLSLFGPKLRISSEMLLMF